MAVGLEPGFLGIPLLLISLCTMAGAVLAEKSKKISIGRLYLAGGIAAGIFLTLSGADFLVISVVGGCPLYQRDDHAADRNGKSEVLFQ